MPKYDAIIIGTGQSGPALGRAIGGCRKPMDDGELERCLHAALKRGRPNEENS
jgi:hypothetical protein